MSSSSDCECNECYHPECDLNRSFSTVAIRGTNSTPPSESTPPSDNHSPLASSFYQDTTWACAGSAYGPELDIQVGAKNNHNGSEVPAQVAIIRESQYSPPHHQAIAGRTTSKFDPFFTTQKFSNLSFEGVTAKHREDLRLNGSDIPLALIAINHLRLLTGLNGSLGTSRSDNVAPSNVSDGGYYPPELMSGPEFGRPPSAELRFMSPSVARMQGMTELQNARKALDRIASHHQFQPGPVSQATELSKLAGIIDSSAINANRILDLLIRKIQVQNAYTTVHAEIKAELKDITDKINVIDAWVQLVNNQNHRNIPKYISEVALHFLNDGIYRLNPTIERDSQQDTIGDMIDGIWRIKSLAQSFWCHIDTELSKLESVSGYGRGNGQGKSTLSELVAYTAILSRAMDIEETLEPIFFDAQQLKVAINTVQNKVESIITRRMKYPGCIRCFGQDLIQAYNEATGERYNPSCTRKHPFGNAESSHVAFSKHMFFGLLRGRDRNRQWFDLMGLPFVIQLGGQFSSGRQLNTNMSSGNQRSRWNLAHHTRPQQVSTQQGTIQQARQIHHPNIPLPPTMGAPTSLQHGRPISNLQAPLASPNQLITTGRQPEGVLATPNHVSAASTPPNIYSSGRTYETRTPDPAHFIAANPPLLKGTTTHFTRSSPAEIRLLDDSRIFPITHKESQKWSLFRD
ncbi:hypothetical protein H072_8624 [Dactylellina haptotyla CBS 200.50]|uniref:Uncharacterized protein n=1 Tax=Dactylellina haptotyla (strain CBS 200.50) TaxID=1284197 RepID=S8BEH5_DACHA|nr:hypothetical protein H072_8624 [Dactylellina haptotyla CBS 200.50]